jgi:hypothetical protein
MTLTGVSAYCIRKPLEREALRRCSTTLEREALPERERAVFGANAEARG